MGVQLLEALLQKVWLEALEVDDKNARQRARTLPRSCLLVTAFITSVLELRVGEVVLYECLERRRTDTGDIFFRHRQRKIPEWLCHRPTIRTFLTPKPRAKSSQYSALAARSIENLRRGIAGVEKDGTR